MVLQSYLFTLFILSIIGYLVFKFFKPKQNYWTRNGIPIVKVEGMLLKLWKGVGFITNDVNVYKELGNLPYGGYMEANLPTFFVKDMELIKKIMIKDFDYFVNRRKFSTDDSSFKDMLVIKEDQEWKDSRSLITPTFTTGKIRNMFPIFNDTAKILVEQMKEEILKYGGVVDMEDILGRFAMDVISSTAFGLESGILKNPDSILARMVKKFPLKFDFWTMLCLFAASFPVVSKFFRLRVVNQEADEYFISLVKNAIKHRESTGEKRNDFLQLMIDVKNGKLEEDDTEMDSCEKDSQLLTIKKNKLKMDDDNVIANCILFLFAGFDSINSALNFSAYALALNPQVQEKLRLELKKVVQKSGGDFTYEDINQHDYLDKVINEALRMYPPTTRTERRCTKDYPLNGSNNAVVPKDTLVAIPIYPIHHDETHFPNPEVFDPERFSAENKAKRSPYAFMPFGQGPRNCIANRFALTETKTAIANLVMNFEIEPCAKSPIPLKFLNTGSMKAKGGMWLKLKSRK